MARDLAGRGSFGKNRSLAVATDDEQVSHHAPAHQSITER
jgi:hypothetical protein